ncbi:MAG TPA: S-methyl-5-thioribose-1-phosphate isomerase, partial [Gallionella sp.]|nr:S-methyl-5-thioribose-1-phosphate isomerase [Gallionella sp.]
MAGQSLHVWVDETRPRNHDASLTAWELGQHGVPHTVIAAHDNGLPFFVALPMPTIDWILHDGVKEIPVEERAAKEVTHIAGLCEDGQVRSVQLTPQGSLAANYGF